MSSNPSYQQLGLDAMSSCFFGSSSMIGSEAPFFYPSMPHDASFGSGGAEAAAHFMASNAMINSPATTNQLVWPAAPSQNGHRPSMSTEEMDDDAYAVAGESCSTVHSVAMLPSAGSADFFQYGPAEVTIAQPSKMARLISGEPHCNWLYDGPSAASTHEPYYLTAFSAGGTGFPGPASGLSLRLGAQSSSVTMASMPDQSSEVSCSGLTHVHSEGFGYQPPQTAKAHAGAGLFHVPPYGDVGAGGGELRQVYPQVYSRPAHFSQVLPRSGYAHIAQELLNGFAGCLLKDVAEMADDSVSGVGSEANLLLSSSCSARTPSSVSSNHLMLPADEHRQDGAADGGRWTEAQRVRDELLKLLQLMDERCNRCFDDIQATASKFSSMVAHPGGCGGGGVIAPPPFALRAVSAVYRRLRKRITGLMVAAAQRSGGHGEPLSLADKERSWESSFIQKHWALQQLRRGDQQSWRPQRGLPEKSVAVLKAWMFENFLRPYPKDHEKDMLAARSGLSRSQVSNWFINARVRLWKPMIEEMYKELKRSGEVEHLGGIKDVVVG